MTDSTLRRIEKFDPRLKSYAFVMADAALSAARAADADIAQGHYRGVLHGIPIGVKDLCYTVDAPTAAGTAIFRGFRSPHDATVVAPAARCRSSDHRQVGHDREGAYLGYHPQCSDTGQSLASGSVGRCVLEWLQAWPPPRGLCFGSIGSDTGGSDPISDERLWPYRNQTDVGPGQPARNRGTRSEFRPRRDPSPAQLAMPAPY